MSTKTPTETTETPKKSRMDFGELRNDTDFITKSTNLENVSVVYCWFELNICCCKWKKLILVFLLGFRCNRRAHFGRLWFSKLWWFEHGRQSEIWFIFVIFDQFALLDVLQTASHRDQQHSKFIISVFKLNII